MDSFLFTLGKVRISKLKQAEWENGQSIHNLTGKLMIYYNNFVRSVVIKIRSLSENIL